jgi:hypothetical protein
LGQFTKNCRTFHQKYCGFGIRDSGSEIRDSRSEIRDPRSGIRKKTFSGSRIQGSKRHRIPDPGVKKAPDPGSRHRIPDLDPQHCLQHCLHHVYQVLIHSIACLLCLYLTFILQDLDLGGVATAYGLLRLPKMPELKRLQVGLHLFLHNTF